MSAVLSCRIEPSTSVSELSFSRDYQTVERLFTDPMTVTMLELISNPLHETREREETTLMLSDEDKDCFLKALHTPPEPNQKLRDAFDYYAKLKNE